MLDAKIEDYVNKNLNSFANDVVRLVSQPSVSARREGIDECARLVEEMLKEIGASTRVLHDEGFAPLVYGEILSTKSKKTILFYNHYDVQPEEPLELWKSPPFKPEIRDGKIYGRGASDDKGELVSRLKLIEAYMKVHGEPPCNVKFCFEGEEEVGSTHLHDYISHNRELFRSDGVFWEYGETSLDGHPSVALGVKGMIYLEFTIKSLEADAHSSFAAALPSAPWRMVRLLNILKDENQRVLVPGWYDSVETLDDEEEKVLDDEEFDGKGFLASHGAKGFLGGMTPSQAKKALARRPTANIAGIWAGYTGPGGKTVLPKEIHCKMDFRLVPNQDPDVLMAKLRAYLAEKGYADVGIDAETMEPAARTSYKDSLAKAAVAAGARTWGKKAVVKISEAGTGPLYIFTRDYKVPAISMGVSASDAAIHSPNENLRLEYMRKGMLWFADTIDEFLRAS